MSDPSGPLLSVRGEARLTVAPDCVLLAGVIESSRDSKAEALRAASASLDGLTADLAALGGVALGTLDALGTVLASHEAFSVRDVSWEVDWDNPAWPQVRAAAIQAAIRKGRDYAAALGGSLHDVEHIADVGLLGGNGESGGLRFTSARMARAASGPGGEPDAPSLDPVPQELTATIEARFTATGVSLAGN